MKDEKECILPSYFYRRNIRDQEREYIKSLEKDPSALIDHFKIINKLATKYGIEPYAIDRICNSQFKVAKEAMKESALPNIKFIFLGKFCVTKGRRYYLALKNEFKKLNKRTDLRPDNTEDISI